MKRSVSAWILALSLLLSGCDLGLGGEYLWQASHPIPEATDGGLDITASDYADLYQALEQAVETGIDQLTISVTNYDRNAVELDMKKAADTLCVRNPIAAYAIEDFRWQLGSAGGEQVLAVQIDYIYDQSHIKKIKTYSRQQDMEKAIYEALGACEASVVFRVSNYLETDFVQLVEDYASDNPHVVMELPQVTVGLYPETGADRLVEIKFIYQTSRDTLRNMQVQVQTVVEAGVDIVSVTEDLRGKYIQVYALVMERLPQYTYETSITPAYSLLLYGVGDSRIIATVFAAVCREAGLEYQTVVGTYNGEPRYWNIVRIEGMYYHVDLLRSKEEGQFREMADYEMEGYVWDYLAYPPCGPDEPADEPVEEPAEQH